MTLSDSLNREPVEEPQELEEALDGLIASALDDLQARAMDVASMEAPKAIHMLHHREAAAKRMRDARAALVALFDRQREHREFLYAEAAKKEVRIASLFSQLAEKDHRIRELERDNG